MTPRIVAEQLEQLDCLLVRGVRASEAERGGRARVARERRDRVEREAHQVGGDERRDVALPVEIFQPGAVAVQDEVRKAGTQLADLPQRFHVPPRGQKVDERQAVATQQTRSDSPRHARPTRPPRRAARRRGAAALRATRPRRSAARLRDVTLERGEQSFGGAAALVEQQPTRRARLGRAPARGVVFFERRQPGVVVARPPHVTSPQPACGRARAPSTSRGQTTRPAPRR